MKYRNLNKLLWIFLVTLLLSSCQSDKSRVGGFFNLDTDLKIDFIVDADINPDESKRPSPLFIRMYELKTNKMMKNADFLDLFERDEELLGADMVVKHSLKRFKPGESRTEKLVLDPDTKLVGLFAEFLDFKNARFKLIIPVVSNNVFRNSVVIRVSGNELIFEDEE